MQHDRASNREGLEFRLVLRMSRDSGWRASVVAPDATEREFVSPFELARFLAWPGPWVPQWPLGGLC
ncbi:MAG: hypothetical protein ABIQ06_09590 [Caldimonas sp.]